tara:strand:+ start:293 stop:511 length:219 start_codon:yes stop_codon:yes gene_type:complete
MKEKQLLTKETGAKIYAIIYLIAFLFYLIFIGIDIFTPLEDKTFDLLGNFLFYAGSGFFAIIGFANLTLFRK